MAKWDQIQRSFSGGEVSPRMLMRSDWQGHAESVLRMINFMPTLQGTAIRTPGTRFIEEVTGGVARIIPYISPTNDKAVAMITPASSEGADDGVFRIITGLGALLSRNSAWLPQDLASPTTQWVTINTNALFIDGKDGWAAEPDPSELNGVLFGWQDDTPGTLKVQLRAWKYAKEPTQAVLAQVITIPADTDSLNVALQWRLPTNFSGTGGSYVPKYTAEFKIGTTLFDDDIWGRTWDETTNPAPVQQNIFDTVDSLTLTAGQNLYVSVGFTAIGTAKEPSAPVFFIDGFLVRAEQPATTAEVTLSNLPYIEDEIGDIQYIQSPYPSNADIPTSSGKELVLTHPNHPPAWIYYNGTNYVYVAIPFTNQGAGSPPGTPSSWTPDEWAGGSYPAACTSFNGRLILAGSASAKLIAGTTLGSPSETVWGSAVGAWSMLADPDITDDVTPDDGIQFATIYRSAIQWVYGQKTLLIGAQEMEYTASADGVFQPADLGVVMHSTHGSSNVQPVGMGHAVMFPAEAGTKIRAMHYVDEDGGYVAQDMTLFHPNLFFSGIVRIVRMRNPHQLVVVVMGNGQLALLSEDKNAGVSGWSRINLNNKVVDACVVPDEDGVDILYLLVKRLLDGDEVLYFEAIPNWTDGGAHEYLQSSSYQILDNTNVLTGLDHLEGKYVQVLGDNNYLGSYLVTSGNVTLVDEVGVDINIAEALVGLPMRAKIDTLPIMAGNPGDTKRYTQLTVRGLFSSNVLINGKRPASRTPATLLDQSEPVSILQDNTVVTLGSDALQQVTIEENAPVRAEVIGVFGHIKGNTI